LVTAAGEFAGCSYSLNHKTVHFLKTYHYKNIYFLLSGVLSSVPTVLGWISLDLIAWSSMELTWIPVIPK